jgi:16S rRNA (cytidine1402-2'-O)-methyltransferase
MESFESFSFRKFIETGSRCKYPPGLYLVATPIGNLEDISLRALFTLAKADFIYCEDTRVTKKLLTHYGLSGSLRVYNDSSTAEVRESILSAIQAGKKIALVSDAGMPLVSDPGYKLVQAVVAHNLYLTCIPGASASLMGLVISGFPTDHFWFKGFLPRKTQELHHVLQNLPANETIIFYESANRLIKTLQALIEIPSVCRLAVARELTKKFEEVKRGSAQELLTYYEAHPPQGEVVLLLQTTASPTLIDLDQEINERLLAGERAKEIAQDLAILVKQKKSEIYHRVLELKKEI